MLGIPTLLATAALVGAPSDVGASAEDDRRIVASLDLEYQAAVKRNDATTMARILDERFVLVLGDGKTYNRKDLIESATKREITYERQDEEPGTQVVRVYGDTAVVTALLWLKGVQEGTAFDYRLWFSDTYVRTPTERVNDFETATEVLLVRLRGDAGLGFQNRVDPEVMRGDDRRSWGILERRFLGRRVDPYGLG